MTVMRASDADQSDRLEVARRRLCIWRHQPDTMPPRPVLDELAWALDEVTALRAGRAVLTRAAEQAVHATTAVAELAWQLRTDEPRSRPRPAGASTEGR